MGDTHSRPVDVVGGNDNSNFRKATTTASVPPNVVSQKIAAIAAGRLNPSVHQQPRQYSLLSFPSSLFATPIYSRQNQQPSEQQHQHFTFEASSLSPSVWMSLLKRSTIMSPLNRSQCAASEAASTSPPPPPPPPPPPSSSASAPPSPTDGSVDSIEAIAKSVTAFRHPGTYEQAIHDGKRLVMLDTFDGFRCDINKQVSPFMAAIHSFHLGTSLNPMQMQQQQQQPEGSSRRTTNNTYTFITQVADETGLSMARIDPVKGTLDGRLHKPIFGGIAMGKLQLAITAPPFLSDNQQDSNNEAATAAQANDTLMAEIDFGGATWASNIKYGCMGGGIVYGGNYIQTIHPNVVAGGEGMYISSNGNFISSYSIKCNWKAKVGLDPTATPVDDIAAAASSQAPPGMHPNPDEEPGASMICGNFNTGQMVSTINYKRCVTPHRLTVGAELQFSPITLDSQVIMGAEYKWARSKLNLCIDGGGRIQSILEAKYGIAHNSPTLLFSAEMDHYNDHAMKFGYGINIES